MSKAIRNCKILLRFTQWNDVTSHLLFFANLWVLAGQAGYGSTRLNSYF